LRLKDARGQEMEVPSRPSECRLPEGVYSLWAPDSNRAADNWWPPPIPEALDGRPFRLGTPACP
jgi:hypothetical protein